VGMFNSVYGITLGSRINQFPTQSLVPFSKELYQEVEPCGFERMFKDEHYYTISKFNKSNQYNLESYYDLFETGFVSAINGVIYKIAMIRFDTDKELQEKVRQGLKTEVIKFFNGTNPQMSNNGVISYSYWENKSMNLVMQKDPFLTGIFLTWDGLPSLNPKRRGLLDKMFT